MKAGYKILGIAISEIHNDDIQSMIYPLNRFLTSHGWRVIIFNCATDLYQHSNYDYGEAGVFDLVNFEYIDAFLVFPRRLYNQDVLGNLILLARKYNKPFIMIEGEYKYPGTIPIFFEEEKAFQDLVTHLIKHHHIRDFFLIAGFKDNDFSNHRIQIFEERLALYNIPFDESTQLDYGDFYEEPTRRVIQKIIRSGKMPEAIVCINDTMAATVCEELLKYGIRVPEDVIVTGFDGSEQHKYSYPRITTCSRDMDQFAEYLYQLIEEARVEHEYVVVKSQNDFYQFPYSFQPEGSCGCRMCSAEDLGNDFANLYALKEEETRHNRAMNNMTSKLMATDHIDQIHHILKYYMPLNGYYCLNDDFYGLEEIYHPWNQAFTKDILSHRFFKNEREIVKNKISVDEIIPNWEEFVETKAPLVIMSIHNQQYVYGYVAGFGTGENEIQFGIQMKRFNRFVGNQNNAITSYVEKRRIRRANDQLQNIQEHIIMGFADIVESRDLFTGQHIKRTSQYLKILVEAMGKIPEYANQLTQTVQSLMCKAAPLHDIGKINVSDVILNKPDRLTKEEFDQIKEHTVAGAAILDNIMASLVDPVYLNIARDMALYHHEKWDGSGYPSGMSGVNIPLSARLMAIVDVFDALTSERVYKKAFSVEKAYQIMETDSGTHFDPKVFEVFKSVRPQIEAVLQEHSDPGEALRKLHKHPENIIQDLHMFHN